MLARSAVKANITLIKLMKRFTEQFKNRAKSVHLTASERAAMRDRLQAYMEYHPLAANTTARTPEAAATTTRWWAYWRPLAGSLTALILILVPVMAERSMPGDMLYAVKVKFNEEVRGSLSSSSYEEVEWATERLNQRLVEAQLLAQEGRLTDEFETEIAAAVREHSTAARDSISVMREENPEEAAIAEITLTALLDVHSSVLSAREQDTEASTDDTDVSVATIESASNAISEAIAASRGDTATGTAAVSVPRPSVERLLSQIETETAKAYSLLEQIEPTNATTVLDTVPRRLEDVERKVQAAVSARDAEESVEARVLLTEALVRTRKVITYMQNWQLGSEVDIDRIVPIEYTAAELTEQLRFKEERLQVRYEYILSVVDEYATSTTVTDVAPLLADTPAQFASSSAAIEAAEFAAAGTTLDEIERALDSVVTTLEIPDRLPDPVTESEATSTDETASSTDEETTSTRASSTDPNASSSVPTELATTTEGSREGE